VRSRELEEPLKKNYLLKMQVLRPQTNFRIIPGSVIKSPGSLLSSVKTEPSSPQYSSDYLLTLETMMTDESLSDLSFHDEEQSVEIEASNPTSQTESPVSQNELQKDLNTLDHYNVAASFRMDEDQASRLLNQITSEISELPASFVRRLELKITLANQGSSGSDKTVFGLEDLYNKAKINDKLYRLIFERLLVNFSDIVSLWSKFDTLIKENRGVQLSQQINTVAQIEKAFYSIMQNKKYPKSKFDVIKLRHLLIAFDSIGFSQEWFKDRNRKLKQGFRVSFIDEDN